MKHTNLWHLANYDPPYYDFEKELYSLPDKGNTSVDMRLTFNTETHTCYYSISLHNDSGITVDWEKTHCIPWAVGLAMLMADGAVIPDAIKIHEPA